MELYRIRGGTEAELQAKAYAIGVGISLGNKWFTSESIVELVKWSLPYSRGPVIVYVADSIHAINEEVRSRITPQRAMGRALRKGEKILGEVKEILDKVLSVEDRGRVVYVTWNEIVDAAYEAKMAWLITHFHQYAPFAERIKTIVRNTVSKEERQFSEEEIDKLAMYILYEMPELLVRVPMKGYECDAFVYPFDGELAELAENIQKGVEFPEIKERIIDTKPKVFLEVR